MEDSNTILTAFYTGGLVCSAIYAVLASEFSRRKNKEKRIEIEEIINRRVEERIKKEGNTMMSTQEIDIEELMSEISEMISKGKDMTYKQLCEELKAKEDRVRIKKEVEITVGSEGEFLNVIGFDPKEYKVRIKRIEQSIEVDEDERNDSIEESEPQRTGGMD